MCPVRRGDEGFEVGPTWESLVERKIQEAVEAGEFERLEGMGRPLELEERNPHAGDWELGFHVLRNAQIPPRWIELSREIEARLEARAARLERAEREAGARRQEADDGRQTAGGRGQAADATGQTAGGRGQASDPAGRRLRARLLDEHMRAINELNEAIERFNLVVPFVWLQKVRLSPRAELRAFEERWPASHEP